MPENRCLHIPPWEPQQDWHLPSAWQKPLLASKGKRALLMRLLKPQALEAARRGLGHAGRASGPASRCSPGERCGLINMDKCSPRQKSPNGKKTSEHSNAATWPRCGTGADSPLCHSSTARAPQLATGCPYHHLPARGQAVPSAMGTYQVLQQGKGHASAWTGPACCIHHLAAAAFASVAMGMWGPRRPADMV